MLVGAALGFDRGEHGRPTGIRTTLLICLAAAVAMIEANLLLGTAGKAPDSFATLDVMRLPLGILTGMGFIGGGAILRRDGFVLGVTTAATLWFVTVIGLCFGAGQIALGIAASALGVLVLSGLRRFEHLMERDQQGTLTLTTAQAQPTVEEIQSSTRKAGYEISLASVAYVDQTRRRELEFKLQWPRRAGAFNHSPIPTRVGQQPTYSDGTLEGRLVIAPSLSDYCSRSGPMARPVAAFTRAVSD
jgi:putative Mg2+ transporter-C (MgtC) family protein